MRGNVPLPDFKYRGCHMPAPPQNVPRLLRGTGMAVLAEPWQRLESLQGPGLEFKQTEFRGKRSEASKWLSMAPIYVPIHVLIYHHPMETTASSNSRHRSWTQSSGMLKNG